MDKAIATINRVLALRLCRGEDIMGSIQKVCEEENIQPGHPLDLQGDDAV